ncbi:MAG: hypothetical protein JWQ01_4829 [Massilia sp.]|nr:hypothetical protein [Massilia sp.]
MPATELRVPYAQKDAAKALGARWSGEKRTWYVPEGLLLAPFESWLAKMPAHESTAVAGSNNRPARVDSYVGKTIVGAHYFELAHDCSPFVECVECREVLASSGWVAARANALVLIAALEG